MKSKNYIVPEIQVVACVTTTLCISELNGSQIGGGGGTTESPVRRLYV